MNKSSILCNAGGEMLFYDNFWNKEPKRMCKLDNGTVVRYDVCSQDKNDYDPKIFAYIGFGTIFSINDVRQIGAHQYHFFERK